MLVYFRRQVLTVSVFADRVVRAWVGRLDFEDMGEEWGLRSAIREVSSDGVFGIALDLCGIYGLFCTMLRDFFQKVN